MTTTQTAAARVSGTIKALYERACDLVHHEADCPARGRGDEYCKCDAVPFLNDFEALAAIQHVPEPGATENYAGQFSSAGTVSVEAAALESLADDMKETYREMLIGKMPTELEVYAWVSALRALAGDQS